MKQSFAKIALITSAAAFVAGSAAAETVGFATLPPGAINNVQAQVIAKVAQSNSNLKIRVIPYRGGGAVAGAVNTRRAEIGITDIVEMTDASTGGGQFKGRKMPNLRVAFRVLAFPVGIFVRKDSPIKTIAQLRGKRFATEWTAFPNSIPLTNGMMATGGLSLKNVKGVPTANIIRGANDFKAGKTDAFIFAVGAPKVAEVNSAVGGIRILPIANTPENLKRVKSVRSDYFLITLPARMPFVGVLQPTTVLASDLIIYVGSHVSDATVYALVKGVYNQKAALVKGHPSFRAHAPKLMAKQFTVAKYHPGAIKFYKEIGIWPGK
ncbi:MAG TPA: TAXI family TRAP transporter solute-binding subunit [Alphaproteobacteria bacterium]|nr:TAXI family TRAP transporter solute-binding subunit [Alphaproteobacteria bacterium]